MIRRPPSSPLFPYTPLFRSEQRLAGRADEQLGERPQLPVVLLLLLLLPRWLPGLGEGLVARTAGDQDHTVGGAGHQTLDRKSTRLNSSHSQISYAVFCLKKK